MLWAGRVMARIALSEARLVMREVGRQHSCGSRAPVEEVSLVVRQASMPRPFHLTLLAELRLNHLFL